MTLSSHIITLLAAASLVLSSCEHKELCYDHPHSVPARINVDWSLFTEEQPTGMTVSLYREGSDKPHTALTNNIAYADFNIAPATYHALVYNQSTTEFGTLHFDNTNDFNRAAVYANTVQSRWYKTRGDNERLIYAPEWFATDAAQYVEAPETESDARNGTRCVVATLTPRCVVYTIIVNIHMLNIYNVRSARASLDGLADGYMLGKQQPTTSLGTQLLEEWTMTRDTDNPANGTLTAHITSFGLPANHQNIASANHLRLSLLLVDNKTQKDFDFDVGNAFIRGSEADGSEVDLSLSINETISTPIPDVKPEGGASSGFDATVDDWGDEVNIDIGV